MPATAPAAPVVVVPEGGTAPELAGLAEVDLDDPDLDVGTLPASAFVACIGSVDPDDEAALGRWIGLVTIAVDRGARGIRTPEVRRARRVVAVVSTLRTAGRHDARMGP